MNELTDLKLKGLNTLTQYEDVVKDIEKAGEPEIFNLRLKKQKLIGIYKEVQCKINNILGTK